MLPIILKIRLTTMARAGWTAAASPVPLPASAVATMFAGDASAPVPVSLYDENDHQKGTVAIWRDGSTDEPTTAEIKKLFRCRKTYKQHMMRQRTLAMIADIAERYGKTIEYVSAYRLSGWRRPPDWQDSGTEARVPDGLVFEPGGQHHKTLYAMMETETA